MVDIPKRKDASGISGYSVNGHSYLTTKKGFYLNGFNTIINHASMLDLRNTEKYGLELVSRYTSIMKPLLQLDKLEESNTLSTTTIVYQVKSGAMINGKLYITAQILDEKHITLMFNYKYRVNSRDYFNSQNFYDDKITHKTKGSFKSSQWIRNRNRQEIYRRKYKER